MANKTTDYDYDVLNRLTKADDPGAPGVDYAYEYDANSNLTKETLSGVPTTYTYKPDSDELTLPYEYDPNDNLTKDTAGRTFTYNLKNQTETITPPGGSALGMSYADADQTKRVQKGSARFAYNELGLSSQTDQGSGNPHTTYFVRDPEGMLVEVWDRDPSNAVRPKYYLLDGLQSVRGTVDASGNVTRFDYEPYGKRLGSSGPADPFQFASGYYDSELDLYKFGTRYYDPSVARWTQRDPVSGSIWNPLTLNPYVYVGGDPINAVDPSGTCWTGLCWAEHTYEDVSGYVEQHRWARCALFAGGTLAYGGAAVHAVRGTIAMYRAGSLSGLRSIGTGTGAKLGTGGSLAIIASQATGGCLY